MTTANWPLEVNQHMLLRQGYSEQDEDSKESFKPEKGPPITWDSASAVSRLYQVTMRMTTAEKDSLDLFYRGRLGHGADRFRRLVPGSDSVYADFKFDTPINWSEVAKNMWNGSTTLRRMP